MTDREIVRSLSASLAADFDDLYADLDRMATAIRSAVVPEGSSALPDTVGPFDDEQLVAMREHAVGLLSRRAMADGAGFIFNADRIAVHEQLIQWQVRSQDGGFEPYGFVYDADSTEYYDFMRLPWFETPRRTGTPTLAGPYLDYLGVDEYVLTATVPMISGELFIGVSGADIQVSDLERIMLGRCRGLHIPVALVTAEDRIVCSTSAHYLPGDRLPETPEAGHRVVLPTRWPTLAVHWGEVRSP
ncbi:MAG TPA: hypothetical protein VIG75_12140 [Citricoccus sp.]